MKANILNVAAVTLSFLIMNASGALADDGKVPEGVKQEVIDAEKQSPEKEKTEEGEASGNVEDCEPSNDSGDKQDGVEKKNLDECKEMVK